MRVVGGKSGGVPLTVPKRGTRPTSDKVRGALFSMINEFIEGSKCPDLFAGSGALGLEALSRGAESCVFVDMGKESCLAISSNLKKTRLEKGFVKRQVAKSYIQNCNNSFDVIFADPPYGEKNIGKRSESFAQQLLDDENLPSLLKANGSLILGHTKRDTLEISNPWQLRKTLKHGDTLIEMIDLIEA